MNRGGFLKSLITIVIAPDIISQLEVKPHCIPNTNKMFHDLMFAVPDYVPRLLAKYGNTNSWLHEMELLEKDKIENPKLYEFTNQSHRRPEET